MGPAVENTLLKKRNLSSFLHRKNRHLNLAIVYACKAMAQARNFFGVLERLPMFPLCCAGARPLSN
jgi:hypothetical protein